MKIDLNVTNRRSDQKADLGECKSARHVKYSSNVWAYREIWTLRYIYLTVGRMG